MPRLTFSRWTRTITRPRSKRQRGGGKASGITGRTRYQEGIEFSYEVLATTENMGIGHWHTEFTRLTSNSTVELDGIFLVELDADGKCTEFREWWHKKG